MKITAKATFERKAGEKTGFIIPGNETANHFEFQKNGESYSAEKLFAMAFACSFSTSLVDELEAAGFKPQEIITENEIHFEAHSYHKTISEIEIFTEAVVPGISFKQFVEIAESAKRHCLLSKAVKANVHLLPSLKMAFIRELVF